MDGLPYDYEPYGAERTTTKHDDPAPDNRLRYTGHYQDPTGLYHLRAGQYEPDTGRFTATDPMEQPLGQPYVNFYAYADSRPTALVDPSGLDSCGFDWSIGGFVDCVAKTDDVVRTATDSATAVVELGAAGAGWLAGKVAEPTVRAIDRYVSQRIVRAAETGMRHRRDIAGSCLSNAMTSAGGGVPGVLGGCAIGAGLEMLHQMSDGVFPRVPGPAPRVCWSELSPSPTIARNTK